MIVAIVFAILASILFALASIIAKYALAHLDELTGAFISVLTMAVCVKTHVHLSQFYLRKKL